jgi:hypothetical protein
MLWHQSTVGDDEAGMGIEMAVAADRSAATGEVVRLPLES